MHRLLNRRLFVLVPLTRLLLRRQGDAGSPEASPAGEVTTGMEGDRYTSPGYGWSMHIDLEKWDVFEEQPGNGVEILRLQGREGGAPTAEVVFRTSPPETDNLEDRLLQMRRDELPAIFDDALITVGEDVDSRPIYGVLTDENTVESTDDHWIASYVARYSIAPDPEQDRIIEHDVIGMPERGCVLTISHTSMPEDYELHAYELVEVLRHSLYVSTETTLSARSTLTLFSLKASGGSRPRVQY